MLSKLPYEQIAQHLFDDYLKLDENDKPAKDLKEGYFSIENFKDQIQWIKPLFAHWQQGDPAKLSRI